MEKKEKKKRFRKKTVLLFSLLACLVVGIHRDYHAADAIAVAAPIELIGSAVLTFAMVLAGESAGEKMSSILEPSPFKSAQLLEKDRWELAEQYVHEAFPEGTFGINCGIDYTGYDKFVDSMTTYVVNANYIIREEFCKKVWDNLPTSGSSALKPEDIVTDDQNATILQFPKKDDDDKKDEDGKPASILKELFDEEENSLAPNVVAGIFTTKFFRIVYETLINLNGTEEEKKLEGDADQGCDYTIAYYSQNYNSPILNMRGFDEYDTEQSGNTVSYATDYVINLMNVQETLDPDIHKQIFPLTFDLDGVPQLGFASELALENGVRVKGNYHCVRNGPKDVYYGQSGGTSDEFVLRHKYYAPLFAPYYNRYQTGSNSRFVDTVFPQYFPNKSLDDLYSDFKLREIKNKNYYDVLIDVGTLENFEQFCDLVKTGEYTLAELLNLMERGWITQIKNKEKQWEGIKNHGKTAKETLDDPEKGKKYKTSTGKVNLDSLKEGTEKQTTIKHGQPLYEFLGDPTAGTELEPGAAPGANPGTGTNPDADTSVVIGPDFAGVPDTWWGADYNPSNDPDASTDPGTNPGTDPGTDPGTNPGTDPGNNGEGGNNNDPDGKKPFTPGFSGDSDDPDNVQWYERFPFSIPWDVMRIISFFSAEKEAPVFEIPAQFDFIGVKETIKIDLAQFSQCIKVIRVFIILSYVSGLVLVTRKIIKG